MIHMLPPSRARQHRGGASAVRLSSGTSIALHCPPVTSSISLYIDRYVSNWRSRRRVSFGKYFRLSSGKFWPIFLKSGTHSLFVVQNNLSIFTPPPPTGLTRSTILGEIFPQKFGSWGRKEYFCGKMPLSTLHYGRVIFHNNVKPSYIFPAHLILY